ncbi:MAG: alpha-L-glutamate ligase [Acidobacteriota bacterium]|nr:alpha-L-glutamate ligase [Acidobacteriota bacterium]
MSRIYVLHENDEWVVPLRAALVARALPFEEWFLDIGTVDLGTQPPDGVFYNRMSASSHTRGHRYGPEYTAAVLDWLERHHRRVLNGSGALRLEVSKVAQYTALESRGIRVPHTMAVVGRDRIVEAARTLTPPFITKHNRAGKGLGVRLFRDVETLSAYVGSEELEPSVDGIMLLQEYIEAPEPFITRVEFVGGRLLYAVRVDTSQGFELCPADACRVDDAFCPAGDPAASLFSIIERFEHALVEPYERVLADHDVHIAGIEFIVDRDGRAYTYDINTNTNYNSEAETIAGRSGMGAIADYLGRELEAARNI